MYNKKILREATKNLNRTVAPAKKNDVIVDQEGQRKYPGQITKIMGNTMATDGYGYIPLMVYPNNGQPPQLVEPNTGTRYFPGATEFTEVPVAKKGGMVPSIPKKKTSKSYSKSLLATNQLFTENTLLKKPKSKKRKVFDPNAKYYAKGGFQDDINKHRDLIRDWTYGESIGMLEKAQKGKIKLSKKQKREENNQTAKNIGNLIATAPEPSEYFMGAPLLEPVPLVYANKKDLPEVKVTPNTKDLAPGHWLRYKREFLKSNPYEDFASERKRRYLRRTNPGLNKIFGISEDNYPEAAERRIKAAYNEKMNSYIFERMGQDLGFDPKDRTTWVDQITDPRVAGTPEMQKVYEIVANSKYGHKLDPSVWSKFLSGAQQTANILLPKEIELNKKIPGYTERENYEAQTSWSEPLNVFEPSYLVGNYFANLAYGPKEIAGTEGRTRPDFLSGQLNPEVSPYASLIADPTLPFQLISNPTKLVGKGIKEGAKTTGKILQGTKIITGSKKGYEKLVKPALQTVSKTLDTPIGKGYLAQQYQTKVLGLPEWQTAFQSAQAPKTAIQAAATPANLLRAQTMGTGVAALPSFGRAVKRDYNIIMDDNSTFADKTSAMRDMSRNVVMQGLSLSPFIGKYGEKMYGSVPATYAFLVDNLSKIAKYDPEGGRSLLNLSRLVPTKKGGGTIIEINDRTRNVLAKLGYQIEDLD